jgi:1,4-dihydroxy-2-naphthoyl-CoA hydrolase
MLRALGRARAGERPGRREPLSSRPVAAPPDEAQRELWYEAMPFARTLAIEPLATSKDEVRARLAWSAELCTAGGVLHGGAIMGLADSAAGTCAFLNLPEGAAGTATIDSSTHFLRAVRGGSVEAVSRPLRVGRSVIVVETDVTDDSGEIVAHVVQAQAVVR